MKEYGMDDEQHTGVTQRLHDIMRQAGGMRDNVSKQDTSR
jgi:hypothetical protein